MYAILWTFVACLTGDYQAVAEQMPWTWDEDKASLAYCLMYRATDSSVIMNIGATDDLMKRHHIRLYSTKGGPFAFQGHWGTVFAIQGKEVVLAEFNPLVTGCTVVAVDLTNGKTLWTTHLRGMGRVAHSKYSNAVNIEATDAVVIIRGNEAFGRYVEILDVKTGKTVGHRVYREDAAQK